MFICWKTSPSGFFVTSEALSFSTSTKTETFPVEEALKEIARMLLSSVLSGSSVKLKDTDSFSSTFLTGKTTVLLMLFLLSADLVIRKFHVWFMAVLLFETLQVTEYLPAKRPLFSTLV
ncbi:hypothetical protein DSECCO2_496340 [anaerobic digester metagenome]